LAGLQPSPKKKQWRPPVCEDALCPKDNLSSIFPKEELKYNVKEFESEGKNSPLILQNKRCGGGVDHVVDALAHGRPRGAIGVCNFSSAGGITADAHSVSRVGVGSS
jgi:hypothetical protein